MSTIFMPPSETFQSKRGFGRRLWLLLAALAVVAVVPAAIRLLGGKPEKAAAAGPAKSEAARPGVGCLGRIEAGDGIVHVAAPYVLGRPALIQELRVKENDFVKRGQLIAVLNGRRELQAAVAQGDARVALARSRLNQVKAGAKAGDIAAQRAEIGRLEAVLENQSSELKRYDALRQSDDVTASELDAKRTEAAATGHLLEQARERLKSLAEVRETDVNLAESELETALADLRRGQAALEDSQVYAPVSGRVLTIQAHEGEQAGPAGLAEIAPTERMYAVAEVYESDIARVSVGQRAVVTGDMLTGPVAGTVELIGLNVAKSAVLPEDPVAFSDTRVIRVKVRLEHPEAVAGLINAKVAVRFAP